MIPARHGKNVKKFWRSNIRELLFIYHTSHTFPVSESVRCFGFVGFIGTPHLSQVIHMTLTSRSLIWEAKSTSCREGKIGKIAAKEKLLLSKKKKMFQRDFLETELILQILFIDTFND